MISHILARESGNSAGHLKMASGGGHIFENFIRFSPVSGVGGYLIFEKMISPSDNLRYQGQDERQKRIFYILKIFVKNSNKWPPLSR